MASQGSPSPHGKEVSDVVTLSIANHIQMSYNRSHRFPLLDRQGNKNKGLCDQNWGRDSEPKTINVDNNRGLHAFISKGPDQESVY
jgi:hypothetical protein